MIDSREIEQAAKKHKLSYHDLQRDYVHSLILFGVSQRSYLGDLLLLKGGNALRKAYLPNTRYSKDLDFSLRGSVVWDLLEEELREALRIAAEVSGVKFSQIIHRRQKRFEIPGISALEVRLYFETFYGTEEIDLKVQLDFTESDKVILPIQNMDLINSYSDARHYPANIKVQKIEEILASKINALLYRPWRKAADLFDLIYIVLIQDHFEINKSELIQTFLRKSLFRRNAPGARRELLSIPIPAFEGNWADMNTTVPLEARFEFDSVGDNFLSIVNSLCSLTDQVAGHTPAFLDSVHRNEIMDAISQHKIVKLQYDGATRLVEPYEIEFYVRKTDNVGNEYFWGYDTSGGNSGKIGIKRFFTSKIQQIEVQHDSFSPRFIDGVPV